MGAGIREAERMAELHGEPEVAERDEQGRLTGTGVEAPQGVFRDKDGNVMEMTPADTVLIRNRRTGRTARMLCQVYKEAKAGGFVVVVTTGGGGRDDMINAFCREYGGAVSRVPWEVKIDGVGIVRFVLPDSSLCWDTLHLRGIASEKPTFIDHRVIEDRYGHIIKEYHRWDSTAGFEAGEGI